MNRAVEILTVMAAKAGIHIRRSEFMDTSFRRYDIRVRLMTPSTRR